MLFRNSLELESKYVPGPGLLFLDPLLNSRYELSESDREDYWIPMGH